MKYLKPILVMAILAGTVLSFTILGQTASATKVDREFVYSPDIVEYIRGVITTTDTTTQSFKIDTTNVDISTTSTIITDGMFHISHKVYVNGTYNITSSKDYIIQITGDSTYTIDTKDMRQTYTAIDNGNEAIPMSWYPFCYGIVKFMGHGEAAAPACWGHNEVGMFVNSTHSKIQWSAAPVIYWLDFIPGYYEKVQIQGPERIVSDRYESNLLSGGVAKNNAYSIIKEYITDATFIYRVF